MQNTVLISTNVIIDNYNMYINVNELIKEDTN